MYNFDIKSFLENIDLLISEKNISKGQFYKEIGISAGNFGDWRRGRSKPSINTLNRLSSYFDCSIDYLLGIENNNINTLDIQENKLLDVFRTLNGEYKTKAINQVCALQLEMKKLQQSTDELSITTVDNEIDIIDIQELKNIKLYQAPVSAGLGTWLDNDVPYEMLKVDLKTCPQARRCDFALKVRGDSMEPYYYDGDIVYIKEQPAVDNGQIGIFLYNNDSYIKKLSITKDTVYLISFNEKYKPIKINEDSNFKCFGLVL